MSGVRTQPKCSMSDPRPHVMEISYMPSKGTHLGVDNLQFARARLRVVRGPDQCE